MKWTVRLLPASARRSYFLRERRMSALLDLRTYARGHSQRNNSHKHDVFILKWKKQIKTKQINIIGQQSQWITCWVLGAGCCRYVIRTSTEHICFFLSLWRRTWQFVNFRSHLVGNGFNFNAKFIASSVVDSKCSTYTHSGSSPDRKKFMFCSACVISQRRCYLPAKENDKNG